MNNIGIRLVGVAALIVGAACGKDGAPGLPTDLVPGASELAKQCGIDVDCEAGGIAEGNASISGVASVDAFFQSVINFEGKANAVSSGIEAEIAAIKADFGIAADADLKAGLEAQISANVEGSFTVDFEPAKCQVDAMATLEASAQCDASIDPGSAMVACEGSCEVEASAMVDCGAEATLECTVSAPSVECMGSCTGTCSVDVSASAICDGTCKGECAGTLEGGKCDGMCTGSCETEFAAAATCEGSCKGECKTTPPSGGCEAGAKVECTANAGAMVMCSGRCEGSVEPPSVKAECQASAKAEASLNVECTPPRVAASFKLKAGLDASAQASFEAAVKNLVELRLPRILASVKKAEFVVDAGAELTASATGAIKGALGELDGGANLRVVFGLQCALGQLDAVGSTIASASGRLQGNITAVGELTGVVGA